MILKYHLSLPQVIYIQLYYIAATTQQRPLLYFTLSLKSLFVRMHISAILLSILQNLCLMLLWRCRKMAKTKKYHQILLPKSTAMPCNLVEKNAHIWRPILSWGTSAKKRSKQTEKCWCQLFVTALDEFRSRIIRGVRKFVY